MTRTSETIVKTPRWAVICGLIRDETVFQHQLQTMLKWKAEGDIDDIVVSTWLGEVERYPVVKEAHDRGEFILVQSEPPILRTDGFTIHQAKSLYYALQAVPAGAMCLKLRPDMAPLTEAVRAAISSVDLDLYENPGWPRIFEKKVLTAGYFADSPFYINDIVYYGQREDLLRLASFDLSTEIALANTAPEQFFFRGAFARVCPLIEAYLTIHPPLQFGDKEFGEARIKALLSSDFFLDVLATSTRLMSQYFRVGFIDEGARAGQAPLPEGFDLSEILLPTATTPGVDFNSQAYASTIIEERAMSAILERRFARNELGERMIAALDRTEDPVYWRNYPNSPLQPAKPVRELQEALKTAFAENGYAFSDRLAISDGTGRRFSITGPVDRFGLMVQNEENRMLSEEISRMRRQVEALLSERRQRAG